MLSHLKYSTKEHIGELGTGRVNGEEIYPTTPTLLKRLGASKEIITRLKKKHREKATVFLKNSKLRPYQQQDVLFLMARQQAACFNEQRTGKTPTICDVVKQLKMTKVLIICPASMVPVWKQEYQRWTGHSCLAVLGTNKKKKEIIAAWTHGLVISYDSIRNNVRDTGMITEILKQKGIECVIADEAHRIGNAKNNQAQALFNLNKVPRRYALTGTPVANKQEQIYGILHFLYPDIFTGYWRFIDYYFHQSKEYNRKTATEYTVIGNLFPGKDKELQEFLSAISTQRKRTEVMEWLPEKDYQTIYLDPTPSQLKHIKEIQQDFETGDVIAVNILHSLMIERQLCLSPLLVGLDKSSPKLDWLKTYIKDYPDKNILVFSKFTSWLNLLAEELKAPLITGPVPVIQRKKICDNFQLGNLKLLLINIDAGKEGLTLDNADVTIFTDRYPPVGSLMQAEDRFVATTIDKAGKEHTVIYLVMKDTYEERIEIGIANSLSETALINDYKKYLKEN